MCARVWATGAARVGLKHMIKEFQQFIAKGNVMDMAVGIIIGGVEFTNNYAVLSGDVPEGASLEAAREAGASVFAYGSFLMAVINFLIIAWVVFLLVKMVNRVKAAASPPTPEAEEPKGPTQEELLAEIRDALKARAS